MTRGNNIGGRHGFPPNVASAAALDGGFQGGMGKRSYR